MMACRQLIESSFRWLLAVALFCCVMPVRAAVLDEPGSGPKVPWHGYTNSLFTDASNEGKLVLLYLYSHECNYSRGFSNGALSDPVFLKYLSKHYVPARINIKKIKRVGERYGVKFVPTLVVLDTHNVILGKTTGIKNTAQTIRYLNYIFTTYEYRRINRPITWLGQQYYISQAILEDAHLLSLPPVCKVVRCIDRS